MPSRAGHEPCAARATGDHGDQQLPYIDEHRVVVAADLQTTWRAVLTVVERAFLLPGTRVFARLLGSADTTASGHRPLTHGSSLCGFHATAQVVSAPSSGVQG
jgi:hypothetical protein